MSSDSAVIEEEYYQRHPAVSTRTVRGEAALLFHADSSAKKHLNRVGLLIWSELSGHRSLAEISRLMVAQYSDVLPAEAEEDTRSFVRELLERGFASPATGARIDELGACPSEFPDVGDGPREVDISLTGKCNLRCAYCFYSDEMVLMPDLPTTEWIRFINELGTLSVQEVCLSGGEVFLRADLWEIIDAVVANRMRYSILTNGTCLTDKTLARLEEGKRKKRLQSIQVSIDGSCAEVHDQSRGKGSFRTAIRGLRMLAEAGFPATSRVTVNRHNVEDLERIAALLLDDIGIRAFSTNDASPMGAGRCNRDSIGLTPDQQLAAMESLDKLARAYGGRITAMAGPLSRKRTYVKMVAAKRAGEKLAHWQTGRLTGCGCVFSKIAVNHDGTMSPCNTLGGTVIGRINRDRVKDIWKNSPVLDAMRKRRDVELVTIPGCRDCPWAEYCNGSCPSLAAKQKPDFVQVDEYSCFKRFLEMIGDPTGRHFSGGELES